MKFLKEMHEQGGLDNFDRAIDMINGAVEHHDRNDNFDSIADIDSLVQFLQGRHHDFSPALEQTVRDIIADESGHGGQEHEVQAQQDVTRPIRKNYEVSTEEEEFRGAGKYHRAPQGPEFRGPGKRKTHTPTYHRKQNQKYFNTLTRSARMASKEEEQEVDNWSVDWDDEVRKFNDRDGKKRHPHRTRRSPPHGTSIWNKVMRRAEQEEVTNMSDRRSSRDRFKADVRGRRQGGHRHSDVNRPFAQLMARKARPHVGHGEEQEVRISNRRKTYEPKFARKNRRRSRAAHSIRFESFKQFNEMYRDSQHGLTIDLSGPDGNAFFLLGLAQKLAKQLDKDHKQILDDMKHSDYDHLLDVFDREFGSVVTFIHRPGEYTTKARELGGGSGGDHREPVQSGNTLTPPRGGTRG